MLNFLNCGLVILCLLEIIVQCLACYSTWQQTQEKRGIKLSKAEENQPKKFPFFTDFILQKLHMNTWLVFEASSLCLNRLTPPGFSVSHRTVCFGAERAAGAALVSVRCVAPFPAVFLTLASQISLTTSQIFLTYKTGTLTSIRGAWGIN